MQWSNLDKVDQKIIEILNNNAITPSKEIASELKKSGHDVSDRTIRKRIGRLEKSGIIKRIQSSSYRCNQELMNIKQF